MPRLQIAQVVAPADKLNEPGLQPKQDVAPLTLEKLPGAQTEHALDAALLLKFPAEQLLQKELPERENKPGSQAVQADEPMTSVK